MCVCVCVVLYVGRMDSREVEMRHAAEQLEQQRQALSISSYSRGIRVAMSMFGLVGVTLIVFGAGVRAASADSSVALSVSLIVSGSIAFSIGVCGYFFSQTIQNILQRRQQLSRVPQQQHRRI